MEHDPLCPKNEPIKDALVALVWNCSCELISRVRNDQMRKDFEFLLNPCIGCGTDEYASYVCDKCEGEWWVEEEQDLKDLENDPRLLWNVFADDCLGGGREDHLLIYIENIQQDNTIENIGQRCVLCSYEEYF